MFKKKAFFSKKYFFLIFCINRFNLWSFDPETCKNNFIRLGIFHINCALFKALGKTLEGSGFEEIVLESGMCSSGSMNGIMAGKHYYCAMTVHKLNLEIMEKLLLKQFLIKTVASAK